MSKPKIHLTRHSMMNPVTRTPFRWLAFLAALSAVSANAAVVFADNFEAGANPYGGTTQDVASYTLANTSGQANTALWVRATSGFGASRNGLIDESENGGANFTDPVGSQAYGFRYTNSGVTTAFGKVGTLAVGQTITVTFDVVTDGYNGGTAYEAALVLFNGAGTRNSVEALTNGTVGVLARTAATGTGVGGGVTVSSTYQQVQFSYTVGNAVYDNDGAGGGTATTWLNSLLGYDIALRFKGATSYANIDNVSVAITAVPEPRAALLGGLGLLILLRRRRS